MQTIVCIIVLLMTEELSCLYVDDKSIMGTDMESIEDCKRFLYVAFKMEELVVNIILGIKIVKSKKGFC